MRRLAILVLTVNAACQLPHGRVTTWPASSTEAFPLTWDGKQQSKRENLSEVRIWIDPDIKLTGNDEGSTSAAARRLRGGLENALLAKGFQLVSEQSKPHDATIKLSGSFVKQLGFDLFGFSRVAMSVESAGQLIGTFEVPCAPGDYKATYGEELANVMALSPRLQTLARASHSSPASEGAPEPPPRSSAVAGAPPSAPTTTAPQLPAPVVAATPPPTPATAIAAAAAGFTPGAPQPTAYAIIIGVEKYTAALPPPTGARADAEHFAELARTSLGVAPDHIKLSLDERATKGAIEASLEWAQSVTPPGGRIYFFFGGHGAPDASGGTSYLVPTDGDPQYIRSTGIPVQEVLTKLGQSKAKEVLAIVDSCFSGAGGRSVMPPGARPLVQVHADNAPAQLALFSASSGSQTSGAATDASGGAFTKYILQALGKGSADVNGDGQVSLEELSMWVTPRVERDAKDSNREQRPSLTVGRGLGASSSFIVEWGLPRR